MTFQLPLPFGAPRFSVAGGLAFVTGAGTDSERLILVLRDHETETAHAMYRSTGQNGGAARGQWCPMHGLAFRWGSPGLWFVKRTDYAKAAAYGTPWYDAEPWLASLDVAQLDLVRIDTNWRSLSDLREACRNGCMVNAFLRAHGAPFREEPENRSWTAVTETNAAEKVADWIALIEPTHRRRHMESACTPSPAP